MACVSCRASKVRCRPSEISGVCQKCLGSKKECVSIHAQRRQRRYVSQGTPERSSTPPTRTFSLEFSVPAQETVHDGFETLKAMHSHAIDSILPPDPHHATATLPNPSLDGQSSLSETSYAQSCSIQDLRSRPQFNLASAESLLSSFWTMLPHFPCILRSDETSVPQFASSRPFVLLAILSSASGSKTLHGHSLYDEEFRKVLGLKFTAGGERSLEILQGILIYCAWYPFHLRPNRSQMLQFVHYIRVAGQLVHDLELDEGGGGVELSPAQDIRDHQLEKIRAYLSYRYIVSSAMFSWREHPGLAVEFTPWTVVCCDIIELNAQWDGDRTLASLVRLARITYDAAKSIPGNQNIQTAQQGRLVWLGLETEARGILRSLDPLIADTTPMRIAGFWATIFLTGGTKSKFPGVTGPASERPEFLYPSVSSMTTCAETIRDFFNYILSLDRSSSLHFGGIGWTRLIAIIILSIRLSFPMPESPDWDHSWARSKMQLSEFITHYCQEPQSPSANLDVLAASRVIMRMVKEKYDQRVSALECALTQAASAATARLGCPMLDGSMNNYMPEWDDIFNATSSIPSQTSSAPKMPVGATQTSHTTPGAFHGTGGQQAFPEPWETITMGWAGSNN